MIGRVSLGTGLPALLGELRTTLGEAAAAQQGIVDLFQQKGADAATAGASLGGAASNLPQLNSLLAEAHSALTGVTPVVSCDIQTGTPDCEAQGKELVTQPLDDAASVAQNLTGSVEQAQSALEAGAGKMQAVPDNAALVGTWIKQSVSVIEQAKSLVPAGDPRGPKLDQAEKLLQQADQEGPGEASAAKDLLEGYANARSFVTKARGTVGGAAASVSSARSAANALDCQGSCGDPSPVDGTYDPDGTGTITGMDDANQAIYDARTAADAIGPDLDQADQAVGAFADRINPASRLFTSVAKNLQTAKSIADDLAFGGFSKTQVG